MVNIKDEFNLYRERVCYIENKNIEIENLKIVELTNDTKDKIKRLELEIKKMKLKNKRLDNALGLLEATEYKTVSLIYIDGKDKKKAAKELDRTTRQVNYSIKKAFKRIEAVL